VLARLMQEGVSTRWVNRDDRAPTGASVLISSHDRNAAVFTFRGANTLLEPDDLRDEAFAVDLVYVANLSNKSADCYPLIVDRAKARGALVAVNPGVRQLSARGGPFQDHLASIDVLSINRTEADVLVMSLVARFGEGGPVLPFPTNQPPPPLAARGLTAGGFAMSLVAFFRALREIGTKCVVLTDGRGGAFVAANDEIFFCPVFDADVAGTAGAGDAFSATFAAYVALRRPIEDALRAATVNAAGVVAHVDTQTGLLKRKTLEDHLCTAADTLDVQRWPL